MSNIGTLPIDLNRILSAFFGGEYAIPGFNEAEERRRDEYNKRHDAARAEERLRSVLGQSPDPREEMLIRQQMSTAPSAPLDLSPRRDPVVVSQIVPTVGSPVDGQSDYVDPSGAVGAREPWEAEHEDNFAKFKQMNPSLDWDKVAAQAGGNVPGGNFSAMESSVTYEPTEMDKQLFDYVENQIPIDEARRMLDSRSRAYNPEAAEILLGRQGSKEKNAADMLYSRAQEMKAQAEMEQAQAVTRQYEMMSTPEGKLGSTIEMILQNLDPTMNGQIYNLAINAKMALDAGDADSAREIMSQINYMSSGQPGGGELQSSGGRIG